MAKPAFEKLNRIFDSAYELAETWDDVRCTQNANDETITITMNKSDFERLDFLTNRLVVETNSLR